MQSSTPVQVAKIAAKPTTSTLHRTQLQPLQCQALSTQSN